MYYHKDNSSSGVLKTARWCHGQPVPPESGGAPTKGNGSVSDGDRAGKHLQTPPAALAAGMVLSGGHVPPSALSISCL